MISMGLSFGILLAPLIFLNVRRLPVSRITQRAPVPWSWLRHPSPWVAFGCILITALGINIPLVWVPSFAAVINATKPNGTALVAVMNAASVPGNLIAGALSDRFPVRKVMIAYCIVATAVTLVFWGALGTSQGALLAFAITWSLTAGCQPAMWPGMVNVIARGDSSVPQVAFGTLMSLRSVGTLTSGE
jgi:predicted MFS family arabinose efflux permease